MTFIPIYPDMTATKPVGFIPPHVITHIAIPSKRDGLWMIKTAEMFGGEYLWVKFEDIERILPDGAKEM